VLPGRAAKSSKEHNRIIAAIAKGDAALAGRYAEEHISNGAEALIGYLSRETDDNNRHESEVSR